MLNGSVAIDNLLTDPPTIDFAAVDGILALNDSRIQGVSKWLCVSFTKEYLRKEINCSLYLS